LREIGLQISTFVLSGRWWKGITALFTHHNHPDRTFTTAVRKGALPAITPAPTTERKSRRERSLVMTRRF
jgi:hypothetical protein